MAKRNHTEGPDNNPTVKGDENVSHKQCVTKIAISMSSAVVKLNWHASDTVDAQIPTLQPKQLKLC